MTKAAKENEIRKFAVSLYKRVFKLGDDAFVDKFKIECFTESYVACMSDEVSTTKRLKGQALYLETLNDLIEYGQGEGFLAAPDGFGDLTRTDKPYNSLTVHWEQIN